MDDGTLQSSGSGWEEIMKYKKGKVVRWAYEESTLGSVPTSTDPSSTLGTWRNIDDSDAEDSQSESETCSSIALSSVSGSLSTATSLSMSASCLGEDDFGKDAGFASYDSYYRRFEDQKPRTAPSVCDSYTPTSNFTSANVSRPESPEPNEHPEDDSALCVQPLRHVDYLSHNWVEEDIWASWRYLFSRYKAYSNSARLSNASWRTWGKKLWNLETVSPETLNWRKDCDVTWLYGPLAIGRRGGLDFVRTYSIHQRPANIPLSRRGSHTKRPILKRRTVSEIMLERSLSSSSLLKQTAAAVQSQQSKSASNIGLTTKDWFDSFHTMRLDRADGPVVSSTSSTGIVSPVFGPKKHIRFNEEVEQFTWLDMKSDSEDEAYSISKDFDADTKEGLVMTKRTNLREPGRINILDSRPSSTSLNSMITMLPSTTLKHRKDESETSNSTRSYGYWSDPKLSKSQVQEVFSPSEPLRRTVQQDDAGDAGDKKVDDDDHYLDLELPKSFTIHKNDAAEVDESAACLHDQRNGSYVKSEDFAECVRDSDSGSDTGSSNSIGIDLWRDAEDKSDYYRDIIVLALHPIRQALVDRVMEEFWVIFNQNWQIGVNECAGGTSSSSGEPNGTATASTDTFSSSSQRKRQREEDEEPEDSNRNDSRKPRQSIGLSSSHETAGRFACPFRKYDARRYSMHSHRVCALSSWDSIARVKEHLYRCHQVAKHCKRCWKTFKTQVQLDSHMIVVAASICEVQAGRLPEGITSEHEKRLRSRKKTSPNQSDEDRWKDIYRLLFPNEEIPSPYFESVQDEAPMSPESRDLAGYEDYIRRELPRLVRSNIEEVARRDMQPLEASLIGSLVGIIQDCQDRVFRAYREAQRLDDETEIPPNDDHTASENLGSTDDWQSPESFPERSDFLDTVFQPPPAQVSETALHIFDGNVSSLSAPSASSDMVFSDSGYDSLQLQACNCNGACNCIGTIRNENLALHTDHLSGLDEFGAGDTQWNEMDPNQPWPDMHPMEENLNWWPNS